MTKKDPGAIMLEYLLEKVKNMSPEEYSSLHQRAVSEYGEFFDFLDKLEREEGNSLNNN